MNFQSTPFEIFVAGLFIGALATAAISIIIGW